MYIYPMAIEGEGKSLLANNINEGNASQSSSRRLIVNLKGWLWWAVVTATEFAQQEPPRQEPIHAVIQYV